MVSTLLVMAVTMVSYSSSLSVLKAIAPFSIMSIASFTTSFIPSKLALEEKEMLAFLDDQYR